MSLKQRKFDKAKDDIDSTERTATNAISQLNAAANAMLNQQAYLRKDPDANNAGELLPVVQPGFEAGAAAFNEVAGKLADMQAVHAGTMTVDELIAKYDINLTSYSATLV